MGSCETTNMKDFKANSKKEYIQEVLIDGSILNKLNINLNTVAPSICKVLFDNNIGTGFLIKLGKGNKNIFCLMTNEHVIKKDMIEKNENITFSYFCEKKYITINLDTSERYIKYDEELDITIIEILPKDNINEDYFLFPYEDDIRYLKNGRIYIPQFPKGGDLACAKGKIKEINKYELTHTAATEPGSSGSPIFLENTKQVIGIHKGGNPDKKENYGSLLYPIIQSLKKGKYNLKNIGCYAQIKELYKDGAIKYEGDGLNGKREGYGKYIDEDGSYYIGQWSNNKKSGKGKLFYKDGKIRYEGDFVNDKREGNGKYIWEDGEYYIGGWVNDKKDGKGKEFYKDGKIRYEGDFVNDKREGNGKYIYEDGEYYIGGWANDKKDGKGKYFYKDGTLKYEGYFSNDKYEVNRKNTLKGYLNSIYYYS